MLRSSGEGHIRVIKHYINSPFIFMCNNLRPQPPSSKKRTADSSEEQRARGRREPRMAKLRGEPARKISHPGATDRRTEISGSRKIAAVEEIVTEIGEKLKERRSVAERREIWP